MGAGRDTRTKRRTQIGCRSRGKGGESRLVSASLKRVRRRFPSGEEETQGDKQPLLRIPRGAARLWGRHRGEDALSLGALQKSPLLYLLSPQPWLAGFFFPHAGFCSPKVGHGHSTCLLQSSVIPCRWPGSGIAVLGVALPGAPGLRGLRIQRGEVGGDGNPQGPPGSPPVLWERWHPCLGMAVWRFLLPATIPPSHCPHPGPGMLLILSSREGRGQSESLCQELLGEDGKTGQKWGFWKVFLSFPIPGRNKPGFASLFSIFSPSGVQTCPREGEEKLAVIC